MGWYCDRAVLYCIESGTGIRDSDADRVCYGEGKSIDTGCAQWVIQAYCTASLAVYGVSFDYR